MKSAKELGLTQTQRRNIAKLTLFVKDSVPPPRFNIRHHHSAENERPALATYECVTSACFCGYAPLAGITPHKGEDWFDYANRTMTGEYMSHVWSFLFDDAHKNSKAAAVRRGAYFLMHGPPCTGDFRTWEAPRSFLPDWSAIQQIANS